VYPRPKRRIERLLRMADGLVVTAIAVVGSSIALGQLLLARRSLRLELYDRRCKIFCTVPLGDAH
jgi:hypothetical protein